MSKFSFRFLSLIITVSVSGGIVNGNENKAEIYELKRGDFSFKATNYGARMVSLILPDKTGKPVDVALGFDSVKDYLNDTKNFGSISGRVANRIKNAQFTLNGVVYHLDKNSNGNNSIHGGKLGYNKVNWTVQEHVKDGPNPFIVFTYNSFDGEGGYPGNVSVTPDIIVVNVLSDEVQIFASRYLPTDNDLIPTGEIAPVNGTPYDFLKPRQIGSQINALNATNGYDTYYAFDAKKKDSEMSLVAIVNNNKNTGIGIRYLLVLRGCNFTLGIT
ncbi:OLC1v1009516C1 [Oldenlandia corymbosa var. corymbosa]|uniref:OLC1v1009516C1 n=1 Tax=Oldenlandia corymbosa var. corymbosa TaxID=529605 RepID=A0AAV1DP42_OLDCO|nr:OLC1v1009516C1 [Oldenlandia corymbosa var. corymbosa]